jgi:hypothetical protein
VSLGLPATDALWQRVTALEPVWNGQDSSIPRKKPTAGNEDGLFQNLYFPRLYEFSL